MTDLSQIYLLVQTLKGRYINNSTLVMVAALAAIAMMAAVVVVLPIQQASAQDTSFTFKQRQKNACSGFSGCSNSGSITFGF